MSDKTAADEPVITKRRVTMKSVVLTLEGDKEVVRTMQATDYVRPDFLDAYVSDARRRWQLVTVSDEPDAGPEGYHGPTTIPFGSPVAILDNEGRPTGQYEFHEFPHPQAGTHYPATGEKHPEKTAPPHPLAGVHEHFKGVKHRVSTEV